MDDNKKPKAFGIKDVRFGRLHNGQFVEDPANSHLSERMMFGWEPAGNEPADMNITTLHTLASGTIEVGQLDEAAKALLLPNAEPLFGIDFITKRSRLRRTILAYTGKPEHIKRIRAILRLPRVRIVRHDHSLK